MINEILSHLQSEKNTDRKNGASKLEMILKENNVIVELDRNTSCGGKNVTWDVVIQKVAGYVLTELHTTKAASIESLKKKIREIASLYRTVITAAERRGPIIKAGHVYKHILWALKNDEHKKFFLEIYSNILLKTILSKKKHTNEIGVDRWNELVEIYSNLLLKKDKGSDKGSHDVLFASVLQKLFELSGQIPAMNANLMLSFFKEVFRVNRNWNITLLEVLISALNHLLWAYCVEYRKSACKLGEELMPVFINFWKYNAHNVKIELIKYFKLQLLAHSVCKDAPSDEYMYPWMNGNWKKITKDLFELVYVEITNTVKTTNGNDIYHGDLITVACILVNQMVILSQENKDSFTFSLNIGAENSKRCKISVESPLETIFNVLKTSSDECRVTWLQVIEKICCMDVCCLSAENVEKLVSILQEMLVITKSDKLVKWILIVSVSCLKKIYFGKQSAQATKIHLQAIQKLSMKHMKSYLCQDAVSLFSYHMLKKGCLILNHDIFRIFSEDGVKVTRNSMFFLLAIIQSRFFPENFNHSVLDENSTGSMIGYPLRKQIINWLLPISNDDSNLIFQNLNRDTVKEMAFFIGIMLGKCPITFARLKFQEKLFANDELHTDKLKIIVKLFLHTTFDWDFTPCIDSVKREEPVSMKLLYCIELEEQVSKLLQHLMTKLDEGKPLPEDVENCVSVFLFFIHLEIVLKTTYSATSLLKTLTTYIIALEKKVTTLLQTLINDKKIEDKGKPLCKILYWMEAVVEESDAVGLVMKQRCSRLMEFLLCLMTGKTLGSLRNSISSSSREADMDFQFEKASGRKHYFGKDMQINCSLCESIQIVSSSILAHILFQRGVEEGDREDFIIQLEEISDNQTSLCMLLVMNKMLALKNNSLFSKELLTLVNLTRKAISHYRNDQGICGKLLDGMKHHVCAIRVSPSDSSVENSRLILVKLLQIFISLGKDKYSPTVRLKIVDVLFKLAKIPDEEGMWKLEIQTMEDRDKHLLSATDVLFHMLREKDFTVQLHIVLRIDELLTEINSTQLRRIENTISKTFENLEASHEVNPTDAHNNMIICLLLVEKLLCTCSILEKHTLSLTFKQIAQKFLKVNFVVKIIQKVSKKLKYTSILVYVKERLEYLLQDHIKQGNSIRQFPVAAFGMSFSEFMSVLGEEYVYPCLVANGQIDAVKALYKEIGNQEEGLQDILLKSFTPISFLTLPAFFKNNKRDHLNEDEVVALSGLEKYREIIGVDIFNKKLQEFSQDIILLSLLHLGDSNESTYTRYTSVPVFHPVLSPEEVLSLISHLAMCYGEKKKPITIFVKSLDCIPRIFAALSNAMLTSKLPSLKLSFLKSYTFFVNFLLEDFSSIEKSCGHYITRHIIYTSVYLLQSERKNKQSLSVEIIRMTFRILSAIVAMLFTNPVTCEEICRCLTFLVTSLVDFAIWFEEDSAIKFDGKNHAVEILNKLIIEGTTGNASSHSFVDAIARLDYIPCDKELFRLLNERLTVLKSTLEEEDVKIEINRQISNLNQLATLSPVVCLESIKNFLTRRAESLGCCRELRSLGSCLVERSRHVDGDEGKLLIVQCLSIIGKIGIGVEDICDANQKEERGNLSLSLILERLSVLCTDIDTETMKVTVQCLNRIIKKSSYREHITSFQNCEFFSYLKPFLPVKKTKDNNSQSAINSCPFPPKTKNGYRELFRETVEFQLCSDVPYSKWICKLNEVMLTCGAVQEECYLHLLPLCLINVGFSEFCLPLLIYHALKNEDVLKDVLSEVFHHWISTFLAYDSDVKKQSDVQKKMTQVLKILMYLRQAALNAQRDTKVKDYWQYNYMLDIDYSHVSEVAYYCSMYDTAALCLEISTDCLSTSSMFTNVGKSEDSTQEFDVASVDSNTTTGKQFKRLLYDIYKNVGDVDVLYGVVDCIISDLNARPKIYQMEKNFSKALLTSDIQNNKSESHRLILENLLNSGLHQTSLVYLNGLPEEYVSNVEFSEYQFEVAWRNSVWDTSLLRNGLPRQEGFHCNIYYSLQSLKNGSQYLLETYLKNSQLNVISFADLNKKLLTDILSESYLSDHLQKFCYCLVRKDQNALEFPIIPHERFDKYEPAFAVMFEALKIAYFQDKGTDVIDAIVEFGRNICKTARENKQFEVSEKVLSQLRTINEETKLSLEWQLEEAEFFWAKGERRAAMQLLKHLMKETENGDSDSVAALHPVALSVYGHWLGETRSQSPVFIMEKYLEPAIAIMESDDYTKKHSPIYAYHTLARYADVQYQSTSHYIKSDVFEKKKAVIRKNRNDLEIYASGKQSTDPVVKRHYKNLEKQCIEDEEECSQAVADQKKFLHKAIYNYCKCLECGDKFNIKIIRLCSLWFDEFLDEEVNTKLKLALANIESRKLLPIIYQVAARLGTVMTTQCDLFKKNVEKIILKCITDHPHHSVFVLLALCHANMDKKIVAKQKTGKLSQKLLTSIDAQDKTRIDAACAVLDQLRNRNGKYVQNVEHLANAYIELAYWDINHLKTETGPFELPNHKQLKKITNLSSISVPSIDLKVDPSLQYKDIVYISKFEGTFTHCGGVNLPKVVTCICSDGVKRKQLIKGRDDLRQDAVMQQVFGAVNALLQNDANTRKRNLAMRTYKVVPLSKKSGLMEWCEGTMPLGNYLIGSRTAPGAHQRYHPNDWTARDCRKKLSEATLYEGRNSKHNVFMEIERHFHPVLRHFFLEKFLEPSSWYNKRVTYTKSTAVSSIVGYVVGLGDRHCQNILIDYNSAEVVHIDLGVAFEQGKLLPTPETIPFRLTRDIVDGMGIVGIEGLFRSTCEKTLDVMRKSEEVIATIVEVLLYDPLSQWTISSEKANRLQTKVNNDTITGAPNLRFDATVSGDGIIDTDKNKMAERVLMRLKQKLSGNEGGSFLGVEGQVNYLIQEARDTQNLCRLFPGWQPWL